MKIEDTVGDVLIEVGTPSTNHIQISNLAGGEIIEFHLSQWHEIKNKIDKMLKIVAEMEKP